MTEYDKAMIRESTIWTPFSLSGFSSDDNIQRAIIFGLYSNVYRQGHVYLQEVSAEELQQIVDKYNQNIANLTNDEAMLVIDLAAKRYIDAVDQIIHEAKIVTIHDKMDYEDAKWDSREAALEADREALETLRIKSETATERAEARIDELEAMIEMEGVYQDLVEIDKTKQELEEYKLGKEVTKVEAMVMAETTEQSSIQAQNKQSELDIAETKITGDEIDFQTGAETTKQLAIDSDISKRDFDISAITSRDAETELAITIEKTTQEAIRVDNLQKDLDVSRATLKKLQAVNRALEVQNQIAAAANEKIKIKADISDIKVKAALMDREIAQTENLESEIGIIEADIANYDYEIVEKTAANMEGLDADELFLLSQANNITLFQTQEASKHASAQNEAAANHTAKMTSISLSEQERIFNSDVRAYLVGNDVQKATNRGIAQTTIDGHSGEIDDAQAEAKRLEVDSAIDAAQDLANAEIETVLTHIIGSE